MRTAGWARVGFVALFVLTAMGCGSDGDSGGPESFAGEEKSVMVTAAEGGMVEAGAVALAVPPGALAADTELSVKIVDKADQPGAEDIAIDVYDFGPDGTTFLKPVEMQFDLAGVNLEGKDAYIAWLDGSSWTKLGDSAVTGGKITATTTHFTPFTVVLVLRDDGTVGQVGGQCGGDFEACGGDITGTWAYTGACLTLPDDVLGGSEDGENPFAACTEAPTARFTIDVTGTITFGSDGSFAVDQTSSVSGGFSLPNSCLEDLGGVTCDQVGGMADGDACVLGSGEVETSTDMSTGTYTTDGAVLVVTDDGSTEPTEDTSKVEYCVKGSKLSVRIVDQEEGTTVMYEAEKQ
jgi:hypothetical protein